VVNGNTGSGFHDGPPLIAKLRWGSTTSRPHEIQAQGSYEATVGRTAADTAARATHTTVATTNGYCCGQDLQSPRPNPADACAGAAEEGAGVWVALTA
jgi:hypothetical protein